MSLLEVDPSRFDNIRYIRLVRVSQEMLSGMVRTRQNWIRRVFLFHFSGLMSHSFESSNPLLRCIIMLSIIIPVICAVSSQEEGALRQILENYPNLADVPAWVAFQDNQAYGKAWSEDFTALCTNGAGYDFYGVHCNQNGHVDGLVLYGRFPPSHKISATAAPQFSSTNSGRLGMM